MDFTVGRKTSNFLAISNSGASTQPSTIDSEKLFLAAKSLPNEAKVNSISTNRKIDNNWQKPEDIAEGVNNSNNLQKQGQSLLSKRPLIEGFDDEFPEKRVFNPEAKDRHESKYGFRTATFEKKSYKSTLTAKELGLCLKKTSRK